MLAAAPVLVVVVARGVIPVSGPTPARAARQPVPAAVELVVPPVMRVTPDQQQLARVMGERAKRAAGRSPIIARHVDVTHEEEAEPAREAAGPAPVPDVVAPVVELSSIFVSRDGPIAVIAGRLRRVGDEVEPGWSLVSIDHDAGTVTLGHASGKRHEVSLRH